MTGSKPYESERQASAAARAVIPPEPGWSILSQAQRAELLHRALAAACVETSEYEGGRAWWFSGWGDDYVAVIARWVTSAHERGLAAREGTATEYGTRLALPGGDVIEAPAGDEEHARASAEAMLSGGLAPVTVVQREAARPAGPWTPVPETEAHDG